MYRQNSEKALWGGGGGQLPSPPPPPLATLVPCFVLWWNMPAQSGTPTHRRTSLSWRWFNANMHVSYSTTSNAPVVSQTCSTSCSGHLSKRKTCPVKGGDGVQMCQQFGWYPSNILPSCTSCNIKRTHPKVCHSFCKNPRFPAIFLPGFHWPMEFAAPGGQLAVQLSVSFDEMCSTYNSATNGRSCFLLAPAIHVV